MAGGSHLKRLKSSLRQEGITGPSKSKKEKKRQVQEGKGKNADKRLSKNESLSHIREQFNPFDLKHNARGPKFEVTTNRPATGNAAKGIAGRPVASQSAAEERRRQTLLADLQNRNKVGGIIDRRFGEQDGLMPEEEKIMERFAAEKQRAHKKQSNLFDLEEPDSLGGLTHMGQPLTFDDGADDFQEDDLGDDDETGSNAERRQLKRLRHAEMDGEGEDQDGDQPQKKRSKKEIMEEVIAKSKMHKYQRQMAKDEDEDMREELDKALPDLKKLLAGRARREDEDDQPARMVAGVDQATFNKDFDRRLKQLVLDKRSRPTERIKTEEEKAKEESDKLRELEEKRVKRMRGEAVSSDEESEEEEEADEDNNGDTAEPAYQWIPTEQQDEDFGLGQGIKAEKRSKKGRPSANELGGDEDDFDIDDDLVASGSDLELVSDDDESIDDSDEDEAEDDEGDMEEDEEDEFTRGILTEAEKQSSIFSKASAANGDRKGAVDESELPYSFPCPQTLDELKQLAAAHPVEKLPVIIQRIRAIYHPKLDSKHKEPLENFSKALVDYVAYVRPEQPATRDPAFWQSLEQVVRHIHSLAKSMPIAIAKQFRLRIQEAGDQQPLALYHAISTMWPTSDHFHQVVTSASLTMAKHLGTRIPRTLQDHALGIYLSTMLVQYSKQSKRFAPEAMNACLNTLSALAPTAPSPIPGHFPTHGSELRIDGARQVKLRKLRISDCAAPPGEMADAEGAELAVAVLDTASQLLEAAADTWSGLASFPETFEPAIPLLEHLNTKPCRAKLPAALIDRFKRISVKLARHLHMARLSRRPLELHHHRPLAIKSAIPKFEDSFDPNKHYDPDRERAELAKLRAEHKKERKGALRELRKDARFMAREKLRLKKEKDEAYEKKYKRLVAEIQNEEGREANAYEREREGRKRAKAR